MSRRKCLTDEQVLEMRRIYQGWLDKGEKTSYRALCVQFSCGESTVRDVIRYKTRNDIPGDTSEILDGFIIAQMARQRVLDYLNQDKDRFQTVVEIEQATGLTHDHSYRTTRRMVELNEVEKSGNGRIAKFRPLVDKTIDGQILKDAAKLKMLNERATEEKKKARASKDEPWRTVHVGGRDKAISNQGGQGQFSTVWRRPSGSSS
jgi:hypothetical protein